MGPAWAQAFVAAGLLALVGTPMLRRLALATAFVDDPAAAHKSHKDPTPYLGGVGLIAAVMVGLLFTSRLTPEVVVVAIGGSLIGCLGLIDDDRSTGALFRFTLEVGVAAVALAAGLRIQATDVPGIDGVLTIVWIVGVTNAVNLLDNMDGLAAGVSAAAATAIFAIAMLGEQPASAALAAGLAGACVGFLAHNKRPASIFMGDTGSLFLGFVLAVITIDVSPALRPPASFAVPLMLLALPVLDTATVTISRLRRGRSIAMGGKDHLSHRLVQRGLPPGPAVALLVAIEATVGMFAVLAGRKVLPLWIALAAGAAVLAGFAAFTVRAEVYAEPVAGLPRRLKLAATGAVALAVLAGAPAVAALVRAHGPGIAGATATRDGLDALAAGDAVRATALFDEASGDLRRADRVLNSRLASLGLAIPVLRANLATTRAIVNAGRRVAESASQLSSVVDVPVLPLGPAATQEVARLAPALSTSASVLAQSAAELAGYDRPYLFPSLGARVRQLRSELMSAAANAGTAAEVARLAPAILGEHEPRRYFLAIQDNTELRGGGGVVRLWGELAAEQGRLTLSRFGAIDDLNRASEGRSLQMPQEFLDRYRDFDVANTWQNVNVSPDFAVTGAVIAGLYPQSGGRPIDGVIAVDLPGLAALLGAAGPGGLTVRGWPEPLTSRNLVDVIRRDSHASFTTAGREAFVARAVEAVVREFTSADLGTPSRLALALAPAVGGGHLQLYATRADEQRLAQRLHASGEVLREGGDSLMVVNQNLSASGIDQYLRREVRYDVRLDPDRASAGLTGRVEVTLHNDAPTSGLPAAVIGPHDGRFMAGENRTYLSIYTPWSLGGSTVDGNDTPLESDTELDRRAYSAMVSIPSRQARTVALDLQGNVALTTNGWYRLDLLHQPSLSPDPTNISLSVPAGWRIVEAKGLSIDDSRHASATVQVDGRNELAVRLQRTPWARLWSQSAS